MTQFRLDLLSDDRRTYSTHCVGSREDVGRTLAQLRMAYRIRSRVTVNGAPGYRIYKAERVLASNAKYARRVPQFAGEARIVDQALWMAERIKQSGQTVLPLFPDHCPDSREFNSALLRKLSEEYTTPEGWKRFRLPERYQIVRVDPSEYKPMAIKAYIAAELAAYSEAA